MTTLTDAGFTTKVAYDTVRPPGIAGWESVIALSHELEALGTGDVSDPLGPYLRHVP